MATSDETPANQGLSLSFSHTALCVIPPRHLCGEINRLRSAYDQAYDRWPPHINVLYPFVADKSLPKAAALIGDKLAELKQTPGLPDMRIRLAETEYFSPRKGNIVHLVPPADRGESTLKHIRKVLLEALGQQDSSQYNPHLTIGQTKANDDQSRDSLVSKARLLPPIEWDAEQLVVLVREHVTIQGNKLKTMKVWGTIDFSGKVTLGEAVFSDDAASLPNLGTIPTELKDLETTVAEPMTTHYFPPDGCAWKALSTSESYEEELNPDVLTVSSYNVLLEHPHPPPRERYPSLIRSILSQSALADVLVLQEVCDDFLSYLLTQDEIRNRYPYVTHGPPHQDGCGPLLLQRNIVILSHFRFSWELLTFASRYKNAVILKMKAVGKQGENSEFFPLIIAAVHFTSGLSDARVSAKESQIRALHKFLRETYPNSPCIIAGDTNLPTSVVTIEMALEEGLLSLEGAHKFSQLESLLVQSQFQDAWLVARAGAKDLSAYLREQLTFEELCDGEQGATFNPRWNALAAASAGYDGRPQRYDRILVDGKGALSVIDFTLFGLPDQLKHTPYPQSLEERVSDDLGSDHWGVRSTFQVHAQSEHIDTATDASTFSSLTTPTNLADKYELDACLQERSMLPSKGDASKRHAVLDILRNIVIGGSSQQAEEKNQQNDWPNLPMVAVAVGSFGLGVWNPSSDIDCLFIGPISSKNFFAIAEQRLRRAGDPGVRILRKVKASTGTMLELEVNGIKCDVQYCPAARVVEAWPKISQLAPNDTVFDLSLQALTKLQAFRDLDYIQRSIPDLAAFRTAHRFITAWAKHRGIYLARFGYLGGIHITMMLSRVCKLLCREGKRVTSTDMICTFFHYYANFDWDNDIVFDPSFFKDAPRYRRYINEPMVILTIHTPLVNVARAATAASTTAIVDEMRRMDQLISDPSMTWSKLLGDTESALDPAQEFLKTYTSYVKIHVQYWGMSLAKGSTLVGWLESRCIRLLNDIDRRLPGIQARIWPARFTSKEDSGDDTEYAGCYLIGLSRKETDETEPITITKGERQQRLSLLQRILTQFKSSMQEETQYCDPATTWLDVSHVKQSELEHLKLDEREWGTYTLTEEPSDSENEEDENIDADADEAAAAVTAARAARKSKASKATSLQGQPGTKLRPAADVLSRLRWDPNIDSGDYVLGYDDRFVGCMEIPLDSWKTEQTDEEFIPQHRILYFRRKSDGVVVWDRESKKDLMFGSGLSGG